MASLTTGRRHGLPARKFGLPTTRQYPVDSCARAANAKARATQQYNAGNLSASQRAQINAAAETAITITAVWVRRRGENIEVLCELDGVWRLAITERAEGAMSHIAEGNGADGWSVDPLDA